MALCSAAVVIFNPVGYVSENASQTPQKSKTQRGNRATLGVHTTDGPTG